MRVHENQLQNKKDPTKIEVMLSIKLKTIVFILSTFTITLAQAEDFNFSLGTQITTLGPGIEVHSRVNDYFGMRTNVSYFTFSHEDKIDDINYDLDLDMLNLSIILDLHPFKNSFHLSGGIYFNNNEILGEGSSSLSFNIGGTNYSGSEIGTLNANVELGDLSPYVGFGWNTSAQKESGWGFVLNAGLMFTGSPDVVMTANGPIASNPIFKLNLDKEKAEFEKDIHKFEFYPVVNLGLNYRF